MRCDNRDDDDFDDGGDGDGDVDNKCTPNRKAKSEKQWKNSDSKLIGMRKTKSESGSRQ